MSIRPTTILAALGLSLLLAMSAVQGQTSLQETAQPDKPPQTETTERTSEEITADRQNLSQQISTLKKLVESDQPTQEKEHVLKEVDLLERIDSVYGQQLAELELIKQLSATESKLEEDLEGLRRTGPSEDNRESFLLLESVRSELQSHTQGREKLESNVELVETSLKQARETLQQRERARRQAKEALATNEDTEAVGKLSRALRIAKLESQLAAETVTLREIEHRHFDLATKIYELRLSLLSEKLEWIKKRARFTREDLQKQQDQIAREEFKTKRRLDIAKQEAEAAQRLWEEVRGRLDRTADPDQSLREEEHTARLAREMYNKEVSLLERQLSRLLLEKTIWERRFELFNREVPESTLSEWRAELETALQELTLHAGLRKDEASQLRQNLVTLKDKLSGNENAQIHSWLQRQVQLLEAQIALLDEIQGRIESTRRLCQRLEADIGLESEQISWFSRLSFIWDGVVAVWRYEITSIDDHPITVSKVFIGVVLLFVGFIASRRLSRLIGGRLLPRMRVNEGAAAAIQSITFYVFLFTFTLFALRVVHVPLTAFTVLGGAVAIGVGFGSQNLINNFISGLIILAERPIRVGDYIQIDELAGTIEHIGPRSTRIRNIENVDILVPNSTFLQQNVVNWTLSDDLYRTRVSVGVIYGSPTRDVAKLLHKAVKEHGRVLDKPEPIVLFTNFGDNSLEFDVYFWIRMRTQMERRIIESDIRYRIDGLFREAGLVIAFPQRDVHLDSARPVDVRMVPYEPVPPEPELAKRPTPKTKTAKRPSAKTETAKKH